MALMKESTSHQILKVILTILEDDELLGKLSDSVSIEQQDPITFAPSAHTSGGTYTELVPSAVRATVWQFFMKTSAI